MSPKNPLSKHSLHTTDKWDFSFRRQIYKDLKPQPERNFFRFPCTKKLNWIWKSEKSNNVFRDLELSFWRSKSWSKHEKSVKCFLFISLSEYTLIEYNKPYNNIRFILSTWLRYERSKPLTLCRHLPRKKSNFLSYLKLKGKICSKWLASSKLRP